MEQWRRNLIIICGFFEALLFSGCLFGWPSLLLILQEEGIYSHLCTGSRTDIATATIAKFDTRTEDSLGISSVDNRSMYYNDTVNKWNGTTFSHLNESPPREKSGCNEQRIEMTLIYTFAAITYGIIALFIGVSLEVLGLRVTRLVGSTLISSGFVILALTTKERSWFLWPALNLIGLGSNQLRFSAFQFADLWPKYRATILTTYSSAYAVSTTFFLLMQLIYEASVSTSVIFLVCGGTSALTFIPTFFMPRFKIEIEEDVVTEDKNLSVDSLPMILNAKVDEHNVSDMAAGIPNISLENDDSKVAKERDQNGRKCSESEPHSEVSSILKSLFSVSGILHLYWHFINLFVILFYSSTLNIWAFKVTSNLNSVSFYIKMSGICCLVAPVFIPFSGLLTDKMIEKAETRRTPVERMAYTMQAPTFAMTGATVCLALTMTCKLFVNEAAIYLSLMLIALARPATVGSCTAYIRLRFPAEQFNILNGVFTTVISIMCFVQYPIMKWMTASKMSYSQAHWLLLIMLLLSLSSPIHMMIRSNIMRYARKRLLTQQ